jgi:hypothetical protein
MEEAIAEGKATAIINSGFIVEPGTGVFLADAENRNNVTEITAEIDGTTGNDTTPFTTGAPDADGDTFDC